MHDIEQILRRRRDLSPFLVHLTREHDGKKALENFKSILEQRCLKCGPNPNGEARYGLTFDKRELNKDFFRAVCFTETPIKEIYCMLCEIEGRDIKLEPYGLVFWRKRLSEKGVSPVLYINTKNEDKDSLFHTLCGLIDSNPTVAGQILPLLSIFGKKIKPPDSQSRKSGRINFLWEREWRYPAVMGNFNFELEDVYIGICPHDEINNFEELVRGVKFIDPRWDIREYEEKLQEAMPKGIDYSII